jgi:hypothetical protein
VRKIRRGANYASKYSKWQEKGIKGIKLSKNKLPLTLLFADYPVIIFNLQKAMYKLNQIITEHGLTVSA